MVELILLIVVLRFLRGIIEGIFDVELDLFSIIDNVTYYIKSFVNSVKAMRQKSAVKRTASKLNSFTTLEELPADLEVLKDMWNHYSMTGDERRRFLCLKKWAELPAELTAKDPPPLELLAKYYWKGIGTERNEAEGRKVQNAYFSLKLDEDNLLELYTKWLTDPNFTFDPVGMEEIARKMARDGKAIGVFLLEDSLLAQALGLKAGATILERVAAYEAAPDHHCSLFHLWLYGGKKDEQLRKYAAKRGSLAADIVDKKSAIYSDLYRKLHDRAWIKSSEYEAFFRKEEEKAKNAAQAHGLFLTGVKEYEAGKNDLCNKAWEKIDRAAALGSRQAEIWALRKRTALGDWEAEGRLAQIYLDGDLNFPADVPRGMEMMRHAAEQGGVYAQRTLGNILSRYHYRQPVDVEQAHYWYEKAAAQRDSWACLRCGEWYLQSENLDVDKARAYLEPLLKLSGTDEETVEIRENTLESMLKICCRLDCAYHDEPYPGLEEAFEYALEYMVMKDSAIRDLVKNTDDAKYHIVFLRKLIAAAYQVLKYGQREREVMVYESIVLWYISLKEIEARNGDVEAMGDLFEYYGEVGVPEFKTYNDGLTACRFSGNKEMQAYWNNEAIARGSSTAMMLMGDRGQEFGLSKAECDRLMRESAAMGNVAAIESLELEQMQETSRVEFERQAKAYLKAQQRQEAREAEQRSNQEENLEAVFSVLDMPDTITGPYNRTYRKSNISAFSAEYTNDYGETVVIENRNISGKSARTEDGYFYW